MALIKLIRLPNLVIVALTQYLLNYRIIQPGLARYHIDPLLDVNHFLTFMLVTVLITAGGYIINDITDFKADLINRPDRVIIHKKVSIQTAFWLYFVVNLVGFILALFLAYYVEQVMLANLYPLAAMGLYAYSLKLKKTPLWGNLLVGAYCAGVAGFIWFAERGPFAQLSEIDPALASQISIYLLFYLFFAFWTTLFREMVKDLEDWEGDQRTDCRTLPLIWGIPKTKRLALVIGFAAMGTMIGFGLLLFDNNWLFSCLLFLLVVLLGYALFVLGKSNFRRVSLLTKLVMFGGVLLLLLIKL